jgi:hypothetical protein
VAEQLAVEQRDRDGGEVDLDGWRRAVAMRATQLLPVPVSPEIRIEALWAPRASAAHILTNRGWRPITRRS